MTNAAAAKFRSAVRAARIIIRGQGSFGLARAHDVAIQRLSGSVDAEMLLHIAWNAVEKAQEAEA